MITGSLIAVLAFVIGVAIQRGTICAVLAVEELMRHGRADRFLSFLECGLWAALTLMLLQSHAVMAPQLSSGIPLLAGLCSFGIGAVLNGACAFGTIGRIGNGRLEYLLSAVAAYVGARIISWLEWRVHWICPPPRPPRLRRPASSLYRLSGTELGNEYTHAKSRRIFRDFIDATALVTIDRSAITVRLQKRAHNPHLLEAGFDRKEIRVPWLGGRQLQLEFG